MNKAPAERSKHCVDTSKTCHKCEDWTWHHAHMRAVFISESPKMETKQKPLSIEMTKEQNFFVQSDSWEHRDRVNVVVFNVAQLGLNDTVSSASLSSPSSPLP
ncbi:hypothetical protein Pfo_008723 [Paulownia fortunei]|nr:hypothetical protein Pfo_008723 [Paulownia fortunei]